MRKPTGPVWHDKNGKPLRCEDCGKPRMRGTRLCPACNKARVAEGSEKVRAEVE